MTDYFDVIETSEDGKLRAVLHYDQDCESPITSGDAWITSLIRMGYRRYGTWGVTETLYDPEDRAVALRHFSDSDYVDDPEDAFKRYMRLFHGVEVREVALPASYRSSSVGLAWVEPSELDRVGCDREVAGHALDVGLQEYHSWAEGECYGYVIQKLVRWSADEDGFEDRDEWEDTDDSCWGFIGHEYASEAAREALAWAEGDR